VYGEGRVDCAIGFHNPSVNINHPTAGKIKFLSLPIFPLFVCLFFFLSGTTVFLTQQLRDIQTCLFRGLFAHQRHVSMYSFFARLSICRRNKEHPQLFRAWTFGLVEGEKPIWKFSIALFMLRPANTPSMSGVEHNSKFKVSFLFSHNLSFLPWT
jgi:hypothetical protein